LARLQASGSFRTAAARPALIVLASGLLFAGCGGSSAASTTTSAQHDAAVTTNTGAAVSAVATQHKSTGRGHAAAAKTTSASKTKGHRASAGVKTDVAGIRALNPCTLVTKAQAHAIVGATLRSEKEAPLGPTCIFTFAGRKTDITLAIESLNYAKTVRPMKKPAHLTLGGYPADCGTLGTQMLFVSLNGGKKVLNVTAPCSIAEAFARKALARLRS
jgi:hypothetical protein